MKKFKIKVKSLPHFAGKKFKVTSWKEPGVREVKIGSTMIHKDGKIYFSIDYLQDGMYYKNHVVNVILIENYIKRGLWKEI